MKEITSSYKILFFGLFLLMTIVATFLSYYILFNSPINLFEVDLWGDGDARVAYFVILGLNGFMIHRFIKECAFIRIEKKHLYLSNPIFPFLRKRISWSELDFFITVDEQSRYRTNEAIWIIKDGKIIKRFSSLFYSNYKELKKNIPIKNKGKRPYHFFDQLIILLGFKKIYK